MKISLLPVLTAPEAPDSLPILDDSADTTKQMTLATLLAMIYPIGSVYFNAEDNTNPGTLFGFGTWVATAVGRVPVGINSGDAEFNTIGETGGAKTHEHTIPNHALADNTAGGAYHTIPSPTHTGGTDDASSLQPYEVYYIFKRTA